MNTLFLFASIAGALTSTMFAPLSNSAPSLELDGTTLPYAIVHVAVDSAETFQQANAQGNFTVKAWGLAMGQHDVILSASKENSEQSQQKELVVTMSPGIVTTTISNIDLPINISPLLPNVRRFDLNNDGSFDIKDVLLFIQQYHSGSSALDFNHDTQTNFTDFSIMVSYYLSTQPKQ